VVVSDFDITEIISFWPKTNSVLIVDSYAVLPFSVTV
jgi:hypothetical protein